MGIPVELVGEGIDWPAWVQAVGSIVAIFASAALALWIDQGAARRSREALNHAAQIAAAQGEEARQRELTRHAELISDWQRALNDGVEMLENVARLVRANTHPDEVRQGDLRRVVRNMAGTIQMYLMGGPPNPHLGWALFAVHAETLAAQTAIEAFDREHGLSVMTLHGALMGASRNAREILDQYRAGVH